MYSVIRVKFVFKIVQAEYLQHGPQKYEAMVLKSTKLTGNRDSNETMQVSEMASACICKRVLTICKVCLKIQEIEKKRLQIVKMQGKFLKSQAHVCKRVLTICKVGLGF